MEAIGPIVTLVVSVGLAVGVPLAIFRALDEIKKRQTRIEQRLDEIAARLQRENVEL